MGFVEPSKLAWHWRLAAAGCHAHPRRATPLALEALEDRLAPSITLQIDYSYDTNNFFVGHANRQAILQLAVDNLSSRLGDSLEAIVPNVAAGDTWTALLTDPGTGNQVSLNNPT